MMRGLGSQLLGTEVDAFGHMSLHAIAHVCVGTNCICINAPMNQAMIKRERRIQRYLEFFAKCV